MNSMTTETRRLLAQLVGFYALAGYQLRVTSTDRSVAEQDALYRAGKTKLRGGQSWHNFGRAFDVVPGRPWPPVPRLTSFQHIAEAGRYLGLETVVEADHVHLEHPPEIERSGVRGR